MINPLLIEGVVLSNDSRYSVCLKHGSETTDMSYTLMECIKDIVKPYHRRYNLEVRVKRFEDGRIYVHFTRDISHPDDTVPMENAKTAFVKQIREARLLVPS